VATDKNDPWTGKTLVFVPIGFNPMIPTAGEQVRTALLLLSASQPVVIKRQAKWMDICGAVFVPLAGLDLEVSLMAI
jgi:hypothetical protein